MYGTPGTIYTTADLAMNPNKPVRVFFVHELYGGSSTGSVLRNGVDANGTIYISLKSTDSQGVLFDLGANGVLFPNGCFYDEGSSVTSATIVAQYES